MDGTIKFLRLDDGYGFIAPDDGSQDIHFPSANFDGPSPATDEDGRGRPVSFTTYTDARGKHAARVRLLDGRPSDLPPWLNRGALGKALGYFAELPAPFVPPYEKKRYATAFARLRELSLEGEPWHFAGSADEDAILSNYLRFTFVRLVKQDASAVEEAERYIRTSEDGEWATFNTGLVNDLYDPIYALFRKNSSPKPPWVLHDFCVPGQGRAGRDLSGSINPLPKPPRYFEHASEMLLDTEQDIHLEADHVIIDGLARDRFPFEFVRRNLESAPPRGCAWEDYSTFDSGRRQKYLERLAEAIEDDPAAQRGLKNRLEDAIDLAKKRTRWNYKTAIPSYYPKRDEMSLLLPMCLVDDRVVDVALVVTQLPSRAYQAVTVFPLPWAYQNARLVCRPDSDWLTPQMIRAEEDDAASESEVPDAGEDSAYAEFSARTEVGSVIEGTVRNIAPFGVFVDLADGIKGLVHISKITGSFVSDPGEHVSVGQNLRVKIISLDVKTKRIGLSMVGIAQDEVDPADDGHVRPVDPASAGLEDSLVSARLQDDRVGPEEHREGTSSDGSSGPIDGRVRRRFHWGRTRSDSQDE